MENEMTKTVVITGSTRGIGLGMASAFLARDCSVMISGRKKQDVDRTVAALRQRLPQQRISGYPCDVQDPGQLESLWHESVASLGHVDIWINNAGVSGDQQMISKSPPEQVANVVKTNLLGVISGSQVAARGMLEQGYGSIYNMEGLGSDGRMRAGLIFYGMTKYGVCYFTRGLAKEMAKSPIIVGALRPGMVITDFITRQYEGRPEEWKKAKRIFNIIAERVEVVTPWLVEQMLKNKRNGVHLSWPAGWRMFFRLITQPFSHRDLFKQETAS
jgi:NAD(P)-dependent dehydrogenase (short-subunit alcohol dehydrogenase family)